MHHARSISAKLPALYVSAFSESVNISPLSHLHTVEPMWRIIPRRDMWGVTISLRNRQKCTIMPHFRNVLTARGLQLQSTEKLYDNFVRMTSEFFHSRFYAADLHSRKLPFRFLSGRSSLEAVRRRAILEFNS